MSIRKIEVAKFKSKQSLGLITNQLTMKENQHKFIKRNHFFIFLYKSINTYYCLMESDRAQSSRKIETRAKQIKIIKERLSN